MSIKIGLLAAVNEYTVDPMRLARKVEELGYESLWFPDHPVMPVNVATPLPETRPGEGGIPEVYSHMSDPFPAMAMAAAVTTRLKVATGVCLVPERSAILTANELATLDYFSSGRVLFGIGAGWLREESEILGADFPHRWTQTREYVAAMRELWNKDKSEFSGKYVNFPTVRLYPKPAQKGGPPILIGSKDKNVHRRVAQWGDGWCPILLSPDEMKVELGKLRAECEKVGRDFGQLDLTIMRRALKGDRAAVQAGLRQYEDLGIHRFVLMMLGEGLTEANYVTELENLASLHV